MVYSPFFDAFPKIDYDINRNQYPTYENVTNLFFRLGIVRETINNISSYYVYEIQDGDTPEVLAEKVYGDASAAWIILLANKIIDPQYDWPLDARSFEKYIIKKYGSSENAKTQIHHYEKVIRRYNVLTDVTSETRFVIDGASATLDTDFDVPYNWYLPDLWHSDDPRVGSLATHEYINEYSVNGKPVTENITAEPVSVYDWEDQRNEKRREIKIIKAQYYPTIMQEFKNITGTNPGYIRRLT